MKSDLEQSNRDLEATRKKLEEVTELLHQVRDRCVGLPAVVATLTV